MVNMCELRGHHQPPNYEGAVHHFQNQMSVRYGLTLEPALSHPINTVRPSPVNSFCTFQMHAVDESIKSK